MDVDDAWAQMQAEVVRPRGTHLDVSKRHGTQPKFAPGDRSAASVKKADPGYPITSLCHTKKAKPKAKRFDTVTTQMTKAWNVKAGAQQADDLGMTALDALRVVEAIQEAPATLLNE